MAVRFSTIHRWDFCRASYLPRSDNKIALVKTCIYEIFSYLCTSFTPPHDMKCDVFISYSRSDIDVAESLCQALIDAGVDYWIDRSIHGSENFLTEITHYIKNCKVVLFIASANSAKSQWTQREVLYALKHRKKVIPYLVGGFSFKENDELDLVFTNVQMIESERAVIASLEKLGCCNKTSNTMLATISQPAIFEQIQTLKGVDPIEIEDSLTAGELCSKGEHEYFNRLNYNAAVQYFYKAAYMGHCDAQYYLGKFYEEGLGVDQNFTQAVLWFYKAALLGNSMAQFELGCCYSEGIGVAQDYKEAVKWYRKAADQGDTMAQCNLGVCYNKGLGVCKDYEEAIRWYRKAADKGDAKAQYNLGCCYNLGEGVPEDYAEAFKWFTKAAEQGDSAAKIELLEFTD